MNRTALLQEMGITTWISRDPANQVELVVAQSNSVLGSNAAAKTIEESNFIKSNSNNEQYVHEVDLANALEMRWVLVLESSGIGSGIFLRIRRAIEDLGAKCQILELTSGDLSSSDIQGDIVLAFGQKAGVMLTGERDSIENLRGIVFEVENKDGNEIPLIVTHHPLDLQKQPNLKSLVWDDIIWSRSIWLESRL